MALDSAFKPTSPESYTWWNFVEPIELRCAALSILRNMESVALDRDEINRRMFESNLTANDPSWKSMNQELEHLRGRYSVYRECLLEIAHCGYVEREGWGNR